MHYNILVILIPLLSQLGSSGVSNAFPLARTDSVARSDPSLIFTRADTEASDRPTEAEIPSSSTGNDSKEEEKAADTAKNNEVNDEVAQDSSKTKTTSGTEEDIANVGETSATKDEGEKTDKGKGPAVVTNDGTDKSSKENAGKENASNEDVQDSNKVTSSAADDTTSTAKADGEKDDKGKGPAVVDNNGSGKENVNNEDTQDTNKATTGSVKDDTTSTAKDDGEKSDKGKNTDVANDKVTTGTESISGETSATKDDGEKSDNTKGAGVTSNSNAEGQSSGDKDTDVANNKVTTGTESISGETSATKDDGEKSDNSKGAGVTSNSNAEGQSSGSKTNDQVTSSDNTSNEPVKDKVEEVKAGTDDTSDKPVSSTEETKDGTDTSNAGKEETGESSNDAGKDEDKAKNAAQFMEVRSFEFDEDRRTGTINGDTPVRLLSGGAELGKPDASKISHKYFVATTDPTPRAVGILKIVNLVRAVNTQGPNAADILTHEGHLWKKIGDKRFMWHETIKSSTSGRNKEYRVLYRAMYDQVDVRRQPLTLRFLHEWALMKELDDKREWDPKVLPECQKTAIEAHVRLANRDVGSTKFSLWSWVTDESCKHWYPYEAPPAYSYDEKIGLMMTRQVTVKGVKPLDKKDKKKHLELLKSSQFTKYFTLPEVQKAKEDLQNLKQSRGGKSDRGYYPWSVTAQ